MTCPIAKLQLGKAGVTDGFVQCIALSLKTRKHARISALKSSGRNKEKMKEMAEEIVKKLPFHCDHKVVGFTIILKKRVSKGKAPLVQQGEG